MMHTSFPSILEAVAAHLRSREIECEFRAKPPAVVCACALGEIDVAVKIVADGESTYADLALGVPVPDARQAETQRFLIGLNKTIRGPEWRLDAITGQIVLRTMPLEQRFRNDPRPATAEELINDMEFGLSLVAGHLATLRSVASGQLDAHTAHRQIQADLLRALGIPESFDRP